MLKRLGLACLVLLFSQAIGFSQYSQSYLIDTRSGIFAELLNLSALAQKTPKYKVLPLTIAQAKDWISDLIDSFQKSGNQAGLDQVKHLIKRYGEYRLDPDVEVQKNDYTLGIRAFPAINFETYVHSDNDIAWDYGWKDRKPLIDLPFEVYMGQNPKELNLTAFVDFDIKEEHGAVESPAANINYTNLPEQATFIDYRFPHRTSVVLSGENYSLALLHDSMSMGMGLTGNLALGDSPDYYDAVRMQAWNEWFSWTGLAISLDGHLTSNEKTNWPEPSISSAIQPAEIKNLVYHYFEFKPFDFLSIGLTEGMMVGGMDLSLKYFLPLAMFHNFYPWNDLPGKMTSASSLLGLDLNINPLEGLSIYGQYAHNQFQTAFELENFKDAGAIPGAMAGLAGARYVFLVDGGLFSIQGEWAETSPWMYIRENVLISYFTRHRIQTNIAGSSSTVDRPIGYTAGPDARVFALKLGYTPPQFFDISILFQYALKGEQNFETPYATGPSAASLKTPTGISENTFSTGLKFDIAILGKKGIFDILWEGASLDASLDLKYLNINNFKHTLNEQASDFQTVIGFEFNFF